MNSEHLHRRVALFPLHTVLFPGCTLPLQIFEQRYLRLVRDCLQHEHGFAVVLISAGKEVGDSPEVFSTGCYVEITDWETLENGLLGITIQARHRVHVTNPCAQDDGLIMAESMPLEEEYSHKDDLLDEYSDLIDTLKHLEKHPYVSMQKLMFDYDDSLDISNKLSYLLPVSNQAKQTLLETGSLEARMQALRTILQQLQA